MIDEQDIKYYLFKKRYHDNLKWKTATLNPMDFEKLQNFHDRLTRKIWIKLTAEFNKDIKVEELLAIFNKRCPSITDMINFQLERDACLDIEITSRQTKEKGNFIPCPKCNALMFEYYKTGFQWWCGNCHKFKVKITAKEQKKIPTEGIKE